MFIFSNRSDDGWYGELGPVCVTSTQSFTLTLASEFGLSLAPFNEGNLDHAFSLGGRGGLTTILEKEILEKYGVAKRERMGDPLVIMVRACNAYFFNAETVTKLNLCVNRSPNRKILLSVLSL